MARSAARRRAEARPAGLPDTIPSDSSACMLYEGVEYQRYWDDPHEVLQAELEQHIIEQLLPSHGRRIIDIGCGFGRLAPLYVDRFDEVVLLDGSMSLLRDAARDYGHRVTLVAGDARRLPFKSDTFDATLSIRMLHHIREPGEAIREFGRVLAREGTLVLSYHNKRNVRRMLHHLTQRDIANPYDTASAEVSPAFVSHHPRRIAGLLGRSGMSAPEYRGALVLDQVARMTAPLRLRPSGTTWSGFTGRHLLAPWLIGRSVSETGGDLREAERINDLFACPECRGDIATRSEGLACTNCGRDFPISDGVFDFRT